MMPSEQKQTRVPSRSTNTRTTHRNLNRVGTRTDVTNPRLQNQQRISTGTRAQPNNHQNQKFRQVPNQRSTTRRMSTAGSNIPLTMRSNWGSPSRKPISNSLHKPASMSVPSNGIEQSPIANRNPQSTVPNSSAPTSTTRATLPANRRPRMTKAQYLAYLTKRKKYYYWLKMQKIKNARQSTSAGRIGISQQQQPKRNIPRARNNNIPLTSQQF